MEKTTVIDLIRNSKRPLFTFELLPPLKGHSIERIYRTIELLLEYEPAYINFTSHRNEEVLTERPDGLLERRITRKRPGTIALAAAVKYKYNVNVVPHILCGGFTKEETENALIEMNFLGINDVLALRGDPPRQPGMNSWLFARPSRPTALFPLLLATSSRGLLRTMWVISMPNWWIPLC